MSTATGIYFLIDSIRYKEDTVKQALNAYTSGSENYTGTIPVHLLSQTDQEAFFESLYDAYIDEYNVYKTKTLIGWSLN